MHLFSPLFWDVMTPVATGVIVGIILSRFNKKMQGRDDKRETERQRRAEIKEKESRYRMSLLWAIAKLSYATAVAQKRGHTNGEMEDALESYDEAKADYNNFINDVHSQVVTKEE